MQEIIESLDRYVQHHCPTGDFLRAVLENDLLGACERADDINRYRLREIVRYCYNKLPAGCWGSKQRVKDWLNKEDQK